MSEKLVKEVGSYEKTEYLLELKRFGDAIALISLALSKEPEDYRLTSQLVRAFIGLNDFTSAQYHADNLITIEPNNPFGFYIKSIIAHHQLHFDDELKFSEHAVHLEPDNANYLFRMAYAQLQSGLVKQAKITAEQLMLLSPDESHSHELMGDICLQLQDYKQAKQYIDTALVFHPNSIALLNDLASCYIGLKKKKLAIETMHNVLRLNPDSKALQSKLYGTIQSFLDSEKLRGRKGFKSLPTELQIFYNDYIGRADTPNKYGTLILSVLWGAFLIGLVALFSLFT